MKITRFPLIPLLLFLSILPLQAGEEKKPVVAVVLAGGGALGFAHVGALQVLEEEGIRPDYVIGTSMGSIIGGLYCVGYSPVELEKIIRETDWKETLLDEYDRRELSYNRKKMQSTYHFRIALEGEQRLDETGFSQGQHVMELLDSLISPRVREEDFDSLPIGFRAVGADLLTGEKVVYEDGDLKTAIRASMSVPGVFTPVLYRGRYVIDGGWIENLPTTVARELGADIVIAVSLFSMTDDIDKLSTMAGLSTQSDQIKTLDRNLISAEAADLIISPDLTGYNMADFEKGVPLMELGYRAADSQREDIRAMAEQIGPREPRAARAEGDPEIPLRWISADTGGNRSASDRIMKQLKLELGDRPRASEIQNRIYRLYDSGDYSRVWYRLTPTSDGRYDLTVDAPLRLPPLDALSSSFDSNAYLNQSNVADARLSLAYQRWFGKDYANSYEGELWVSEYPSAMGALHHSRTEHEGRLSLRAGALQSKQYFYDGDSLDSTYILGKLGGSLFYDQPLFKRFELSLGGYGRLNWNDKKSGTSLLPKEDWLRYGSKVMLSIDTLDRVTAPRSGLRAVGLADASFDKDAKLSLISKTAGEIYIPLFGKRLILVPRAEFQSLILGEDLHTIELPALGTAFPVHGYYPQELRAENVAMVGLDVRFKVASLPYSLGNDVYIHLAGNSATLWFDEELDEHKDYDFFHGGLFGVLLNTHLGVFELGISVNRSGRAALFAGISTSALFYNEKYY